MTHEFANDRYCKKLRIKKLALEREYNLKHSDTPMMRLLRDPTNNYGVACKVPEKTQEFIDAYIDTSEDFAAAGLYVIQRLGAEGLGEYKNLKPSPLAIIREQVEVDHNLFLVVNSESTSPMKFLAKEEKPVGETK